MNEYYHYLCNYIEPDTIDLDEEPNKRKGPSYPNKHTPPLLSSISTLLSYMKQKISPTH
jgi:hypothetical protein